MISSSEFGASGLIKEITDGNMYMQTSSLADGLKIFVVEEIIYEILFANTFKQSELKKIRLGNISPILGALIEK